MIDPRVLEAVERVLVAWQSMFQDMDDEAVVDPAAFMVSVAEAMDHPEWAYWRIHGIVPADLPPITVAEARMIVREGLADVARHST